MEKRFLRNAVWRDYINEGKAIFWFVSFPLQKASRTKRSIQGGASGFSGLRRAIILCISKAGGESQAHMLRVTFA
jgi:hypothetical protein